MFELFGELTGMSFDEFLNLFGSFCTEKVERFVAVGIFSCQVDVLRSAVAAQVRWMAIASHQQALVSTYR